MNLHQRINEIRKKVEYVQKDKKVSSGGEGYTALTHDTLTEKVRDYFVEAGVLVVPSCVEIATEKVGESAKGNPKFQTRAMYDVAFINIDDGKDREVMRVAASGDDYGDKGPGKTLSYATKYAILKMLQLQSGDKDEERVESERAPRITQEQHDQLAEFCEEQKWPVLNTLKRLATIMKCQAIQELPAAKFDDAMEFLKAQAKAKAT